MVTPTINHARDHAFYEAYPAARWVRSPAQG